MSAIVGSLACQKNLFLRTLSANVISCQEYAPPNLKEKGKSKKKAINTIKVDQRYAIELNDTILFPEGGGQPYDTGKMKVLNDVEIPVVEVIRENLKALHIVPLPIEPGSEVSLIVDWEKRLDHMQQHTGQHLLSAVLDTYGLETLSWSMNENVNYLEIPKRISPEMIEEINQKINDLILQNIPITVVTSEEHPSEVDISHIPDDYDKTQGVIRIVKIGDLDANPCCGTHLESTSQIQAISLLHQTNIRGGNSRLHFVCGARVYKNFVKMYDLLKNVAGNELSCQIEEVPEKVMALNQSYKGVTAREQSLLKELASIEAERIFKSFENSDKDIAFVYRADGRNDFVSTFQKEFSTLVNKCEHGSVSLDDTHTIVIMTGNYASKQGGMIKIIGPKAQELQEILKSYIKNLKGGGKGNSFQGKVVMYEKGEIEEVLDYFKDNQ